MGKDKNSEKNKDVVLWASNDKEQFYDLVSEDLLDYNIDRMKDVISNGKDVMMIYESFIGANNKHYNGLDTVFKIDGLIEIFNKYYIRKQLDLAARKDVYNGYDTIRIYKLVRIKRGGRGGGGGGGEREGESIVSKTDRSTVRDDVEIVESSKDKEKIAKKIEEERKLIQEG